MHVAFFTVRMRKGFGVDLCIDKWARGLLNPTLNSHFEDSNVESSEPRFTTHMFHVKQTEDIASDNVNTDNSETTKKPLLKPFADRVTVYCFDYDGETYKDAPYEIVPLHLSRDKSNKVLPVLESDAMNTLRNLKKDLGESGAFDMAMPASFPFYSVKKFFDVPTVHLHFGNPPTTGMKPLAKVNRTYLGYSDLKHMLRNDVVVSISEYLKSGLPDKQYEKTEVVYPGADHMPEVSDEAIQTMREHLIMASNEKKSDIFALSVSRLDYKSHPYKGVFETVEIVNKLRKSGVNIHLVLAGVGSDDSRRVLHKNGARVINAPSFEEISALYRACDIFVSLSRWEGFGLPIAEAALAALPTVAYDKTAHAENAVSCKIKTYEEVEPVIRELALSKPLRKEKGLEAQAMASKFTWQRSCERLIEIARKVIS
jgi:glycosyltransferase involved in cell wall biosynthesis